MQFCFHIRKYCHLYLRIHPTTEQRILPFMGRQTYAYELQMFEHELECSLQGSIKVLNLTEIRIFKNVC